MPDPLKYLYKAPLWMLLVVKSVCALPTTQEPGIAVAPPETPELMFGGTESLFSSAYMAHASCSCRTLLRHATPCAFALALLNAGNSIEARIAMMAMTTSNSMRVNPICDLRSAIVGFIRVNLLENRVVHSFSVLA